MPPSQSRCCRYIELRLGTIAIGIVCLVEDILLIVLASWVIQACIWGLEAVKTDANVIRVEKGLIGLMVIAILINVVAGIMDVMLIFGAIRAQQDHLQRWLDHQLFSAGFHFLFGWAVIIGSFLLSTGYGFLSLIIGVFYAVATFYFRLVVRSYQEKLGRQYRTVRVEGSA